MKKALLARRYSKALCEVVPEDKLDEIREELCAMGNLVQESHEFYNTLNNNTLELHVRQKLLDAVLSRLEPPQVLFNFFHVLLRHSRISLMGEIVAQFGRDVDRRLGRIRGDLLAPVELPAEDVGRLQERLGDFLGGDVLLTQRQDNSLLGGFTVRIGDWLFDATLESELKNVKGRIGGLLEAGRG